MKASKILAVIGASALALGFLFTSAEAKRSHHGVRTKHYSHSTSHHARASKTSRKQKATNAKASQSFASLRGASSAPPQESKQAARGQDAARLGVALASAAGMGASTGSLDMDRAVRRMVKSVTFDVEAGIKTTIMKDGSIEEEPFDSGMLSSLLSEHGSTNSLSAFVERLRKTSLPETTGSIAPVSK